MVMTAWQMGQLAEAQLLVRAQERELADARHMAALIDHRVNELQHALRVVAEQLDPDTLHDPQRLATFMARRPVLRSLYASVFAAGSDGQVSLLVDADGAHTPAISIAEREYFRRSVKTREPVISQAIEGREADGPGLVFAQPLVDAQGVWGVLAGHLSLARHDLIADMTQAQAGSNSATTIVSDAAGIVLSHPSRTRLLDAVTKEARLGDYLSMLQHEGVDLSAQTGAWVGTRDVLAVARVPATGWQVWQLLPRDAVLQPMRIARSSALQSALAYAVLLVTCLSIFLAWQLRPLKRLEERAARLLAGDQNEDWPVADGEIGQLTRTLHHVWAERTQIERFNAEVLQKLSSVMAAAPVGLAFTRLQRFELVSAEFCRLVGRSEDELLGHPTRTIYASNEDYLAAGLQLATAFAAGTAYVGDWQLQRADASVFWARLHARAVDVNDASAGTIWSVYDVTEQRVAREHLEHAATHDPLTGLDNRKGFERAIGAVFEASPNRRAAALLMIDLDNFKPINDSAGHAAGDAMLKAVAQVLLAQVRSTDAVSRLGGDEFAVLLPGCEHERARVIADKMLDAVASIALIRDGRTLRVGASIGMAVLAPAHTELSQWLAEADGACYEAKRAGRGTVRWPPMQGPLKLVLAPTGTSP
jgi:diguanylate cyclase (GGDEF)-like protein/PAS domain S-box-containing protein